MRWLSEGYGEPEILWSCVSPSPGPSLPPPARLVSLWSPSLWCLERERGVSWSWVLSSVGHPEVLSGCLGSWMGILRGTGSGALPEGLGSG